MLKPLSHWNLFYLSIALECDSSILEAIFHHNPWSCHCRHIESFFELLFSKTSHTVNLEAASQRYPSQLNFVHEIESSHPYQYQLSTKCVCEIQLKSLMSKSLIYLVTELKPGVFVLVFLCLYEKAEKEWHLTGGDINIVAGKSCINADESNFNFHNIQSDICFEADEISRIIISAQRKHLDFADPFWAWSNSQSSNDFEQEFHEKFTNQYLNLDDNSIFPLGLRKALEIVKDFSKC